MRDEERRPPVTEGEIVAGKYRVDRVIGAGGMGVVVAATHTELDQKVALKFILPDALKGPESVERFLREAKASVRLRSEHVARVYDVGKLEPASGTAHAGASGLPFIVMELLEGVDLSKLSKRHAPVPVADAAEYVLQACEALIEAHANGIIHRDLKPQNLFVCRRMNGSPLVKVLDFGIFKATGPAAIGQMSLTDSTVVLGSPLYMAPEQMRAARNADAKSDVWSLGVILYELLAGRVPFDGETVTEVCLKVTSEPPEPLVKLRDGVPEELVKVVMRCLEKDPQKRFSTVAQLAAALEPFSASAQRGALDRPWRSLVDTVDQLDLSSSDGAKSVSGEKAGTGVTWGATSQAQRASGGKKRGFAGGVAVGVVLSIAAAAAAYIVSSRDADSAKGAGSSSAAIIAPADGPKVAAPGAEPPPPADSRVAQVPPPATAATSAAPTPASPAAARTAPRDTPRGRPPRTAPATPPPVPAAASNAPSAAPPPSPPPSPQASATASPAAPSTAPNGAPILK